MQSFLVDIVVIFALSVVASVICHRLGIPSAIGLLVAGVVAGPDMLRLIRNVQDIELISEIGVVLLLFVIGLELSLSDILQMRRQFLVGGSIQFLGTSLVIGALALASGVAPGQSVYIGFVTALSSTAIVIKMLQERAALDAPHGRAVLATLIYQDIAVVPVMLMAPLLAGAGGASGSASVGGLLLRIAGVALFAVLAYRWIVPFILDRITATHDSEAFLLGVIALCIGIAMLTQWVGLSVALGAFLAGVIIAESDYSHQAVAVMLPFRDVFMSLFFVSIGMLLDVQYLLAHPLLLGGLTLGILVLKPLVATIAGLVTGLSLRSALLAGLALGQIGEFSFVAAQVGVSAGLLGADLFQILLDATVLSMLLTPALFALGPKLSERLERSPLRGLERRGFRREALDSAHAYAGHVLIIGYGVTGRNVAMTARNTDVPYAIVELSADLVRRGLEAGEPIHFGDASHPSILQHVDADKARVIVVAINDRAAVRRIVETARRLAPDAYILVRSRTLAEVGVLRSLGADEVIADELEVSIEVFSRVLARMLVPRDDIKRLIGDVRGDWRRMARTFSSAATAVSAPVPQVPDLLTRTVRLGPTSAVAGMTIAQSRMRPTHGVTVLAITRHGVTQGNPPSSTTLAEGDVLFVIGPEDWDASTIS